LSGVDEDAERAWILARAPGARRRHEARLARIARDAEERRAREQALVQQAASEDAVEAAIARALARRKGPA
jgi:hypothetical protein